MSEDNRLDQSAITTMRALAMDAVERARSGHPGAPMALAPVAYTLFDRYLRYDPAQPDWPNRDRFVLSAGHASTLLYAALHLFGFDLTLEDIRAFRQLGSRCPGHPELGCAPGVETTTGPLGQGAANSVGMAIAEAYLAAHFNRPDHKIVDHRVFALLGDGCMMEGITAEAASLAGHLGLAKLTWLYDSNRISIDGSTDLAFTEDVGARFRAYDWHVQQVDDANDVVALGRALDAAVAERSSPSLIIVTSRIAWGSPNKAGTAAAHGAALGEDEVRRTKEVYGLNPDEHFVVPQEVMDHTSSRARQRGRQHTQEYARRLDAYAEAHSKLAAQWRSLQEGTLPAGWDRDLPSFAPGEKGVATRAAGGKALNALAAHVPWLLGGSADLSESNQTLILGADDFRKDVYSGRNLRFGVREHAMAGVANGMSLSKLRPYLGSFLIFSDYCRPSIRLAAMMKRPVVYVMTHDSIGLGEDGPTHQPVEQLAALRAIPGLDVVRPGDANEAVVAWTHAMRSTDRPVLLALTRQKLPVLDRARYASAEGLLRGGYVLADADGAPKVILIGTGSEVHLCLAGSEALSAQGIRARVVSMPSWEIFDRQPRAYREQVLPPAVRARVAVEAGSPLGWERYVGTGGAIIAMRTFGASAPPDDLARHFGFSTDAVVKAARDQIQLHG